MEIITSPTFNKQYKKLPEKIQEQFDQRILLWLREPRHYLLRVHRLKGSLGGYWSFNVNSDVRVIYYYEDDEVVVLALIGTHSQLY
ncbi:type II toxin-antitoxin system mRNA interferase toxin, RelE/StbE family [Candidatus Kaiserbacteria bacterium]|nr:type II toxin-antitoxin system mRNA interferase toxin, RelE/StbE family [Candidatus Kaiserbacteria bacterium]